jgi:hypothetical protein
LGIVKPTDEMGIVVKTISGDLSFVVILAVVTRRSLFFRTLPHDSQLLVGVLNDLL